MKVRKLSTIIILVLLSAILLAAPVQAGRTPIPFSFHLTNVGIQSYSYRDTAGAEHLEFVLTGTVVSAETALNGGQYTYRGQGTAVFHNPHPIVIPGWGWGPGRATWRVVISKGGELSGWEGYR